MFPEDDSASAEEKSLHDTEIKTIEHSLAFTSQGESLSLNSSQTHSFSGCLVNN